MKLIAVDGSIIDCIGPFPATMNDSTIVMRIFRQTSFPNILQAGDIILVDRGFRDSVQFLQNKNFVVKMPEFIQKGTRGQLTAIVHE